MLRVPLCTLKDCLAPSLPAYCLLTSCFVPLENGGLAWSDDADGGRGREISRDFAKVCNVSFVITEGAVLQWVIVSAPQGMRIAVACESHL